MGRQTTPRVAADRQFHLYIAAKLENKVLSQLITELLDQGERPWARQFAIHFDNPETWTTVSEEHRKIVGALAARDPEQARKAMRNHLQKAHDRWAPGFGGGEKTGFKRGTAATLHRHGRPCVTCLALLQRYR